MRSHWSTEVLWTALAVRWALAMIRLRIFPFSMVHLRTAPRAVGGVEPAVSRAPQSRRSLRGDTGFDGAQAQSAEGLHSQFHAWALYTGSRSSVQSVADMRQSRWQTVCVVHFLQCAA